jgi:hypothetical protein
MSRTVVGVVAGACVLVAGAAAFFLVYAPGAATADEITAKCKTEGEKCYETEVPKLYPSLSIPEVFSVIREIRAKDPSYQFCHVLAHKLGEAIVAEDPVKWLDAIALNPSDNLCSNGFIHGIFVGRYRDDVLDEKRMQEALPELKIACEPHGEWHPSPLDQAICYHGMGHVFMFLTNADFRRALNACNAIGESPTGNFLRVCREGVFMQIYQPLEPDDFALVELLPEKPSAENYRRLCASYSETPEEEGACLREAWPLFREGITDGSGIVKFCSAQPNEAETNACYQTATAIVGRMSLGNQEQAVKACGFLPSSRQVECFSTVAQTRLEEGQTNGERAIAVCHAAPEDIAHECLTTLARRASFIFAPESQERLRFCSLMPADIQGLCRDSRSR